VSIQLKHFTLLIKRLAFAYVLFFFARLLFFVFNFSFFGHYGLTETVKAFFYGLLFDTSAIIYINSIFILLHVIPIHLRDKKEYQQCLKILFLLTNSIAFLLNLIDTGYFPFSGKRSGMELLGVKGDIAPQLISYLTDYWYLLFLLMVYVWIIIKYYPKASSEKVNTYSIKQFGVEFILLIVASALSFLGARGGWNLKPLNTFDAARFVRTEMIALTLNTPFQLIMTVQQVGVEEKQYMPEELAKQYFNPIHQPKNLIDTSKPNIVLIIVESLGKEYVGYYNNGKGYTPFLDSLMQHSMVYTHAYANGKRSIEGIPSIIASMPSWMDNDYMNSYYQTNKLKSTGGYLNDIGYNTSFYHGGINGTMSFDNFVAVTEAGNYYGLNEYPDKKKDYDGNWGVYDEPYLQYYTKELTLKHQPFFSTVFTLSSHHPYNIPDNRKSLFADGTLPIHKSIRYADYSLKQFFETAQKMQWYKNTVFIITADHSAENEKPYYQTSQGKYEIPLIVFSPSSNKNLNTENPNTTQQLDILPLIANICNLPTRYFSFGNSSTTQNAFAMQYFGNIYQLIQWPYVYQFNGETGIGFYDLKKDSLMNTNIIHDKSTKEVARKMDSLVKSVIQQYNHALITNNTAIK
jgi:phosphoglycerol transferase MdoB-like AlkP superfamily enzyme